jgi:aminoglycoside phosphotransferase (APT) family kinase protein
MGINRLHADEIDSTSALVSRLVTEQFPEWGHLSVERFESTGTSNAIFRLGDELSVRLPRVPRATTQADKEHRWLPRLAPDLPLAIPVPVAYGSPSDAFAYPWLVTRWIDGEPAHEERVPAPAQLADRLAEFVRTLSKLDPTGGPPTRRGAPLISEDDGVREALAQLGGSIDTAAAARAWEDALAAPAWVGPPTWLHGDLMPGNLLLRDGELVAVIDFGSLGVGDPAADLIPAWNLLPGDVRPRYRDALDVDEPTWRRGRGWALSMALKQLPYYALTNPSMAANARFAIAAVLADGAT